MNWLDDVKWDAAGPGAGDRAGDRQQRRADVRLDEPRGPAKTAELGRAVYFSRSRDKLWYKGEESGHVQTVREIRLDCDRDVILLKVVQLGDAQAIACHTGRHSCFYSLLDNGAWVITDPVLKDPASIYK